MAMVIRVDAGLYRLDKAGGLGTILATDDLHLRYSGAHHSLELCLSSHASRVHAGYAALGLKT